MDRYKQLWKKLKLNIKDQNVLNLIAEYEQEIKLTRRSNCNSGKRYGIKISSQPWYGTYHRIMQMLHQKMGRKTITRHTFNTFKTEFSNWMKLLIQKKKTEEDMTRWLEQKYKEFASIRKDTSGNFKKPITTPSGFTRKTRSKLSLDERAAIIIDELIYKFKPQIPKNMIDKIDLDIDYYKEDWQQELWAYCWKQRFTDPNLSVLISNYNGLSSLTYKFHLGNFLSRMNKYIVPYIARLQYSINDVARYNLTDKYKKEEFYPSDDLSVIEDKKYIQDAIELEQFDNHIMVTDIMKYFDENIENLPRHQKETWRRYKQVIEMRYGFNENERIYSLQEIGNNMGVTRERIRQIESMVLRIIRKYLKTKENQYDNL